MPEQPVSLHFNIDDASLHVSSASPAFSVSGWCFSLDSREPVELQVRCGTEILSRLVCDIAREDLVDVVPPEVLISSAVPKCGFECWVNLPEKYQTVELYSPRYDQVLESFSSKDMIVAESGWLVGQGGTARKNRLRALRGIVRKAKRVVRKDTILSIDNWKLWLLHAREEFRRYRHITVSPAPEGTLLTPADAFIEKNQIKPHIRGILQKAVDGYRYRPTISLIMPVYNVDPQFLEEAIASV